MDMASATPENHAVKNIAAINITIWAHRQLTYRYT
jgi:hypothetical protein